MHTEDSNLMVLSRDNVFFCLNDTEKVFFTLPENTVLKDENLFSSFINLSKNVMGEIPEGATILQKSENYQPCNNFKLENTEFYACTAFKSEDKLAEWGKLSPLEYSKTAVKTNNSIAHAF